MPRTKLSPFIQRTINYNAMRLTAQQQELLELRRTYSDTSLSLPEKGKVWASIVELQSQMPQEDWKRIERLVACEA